MRIQRTEFAVAPEGVYPLVEMFAVELWPNGPVQWVINCFPVDEPGTEYERTAPITCPRHAEMWFMAATGGVDVNAKRNAYPKAEA